MVSGPHAGIGRPPAARPITSQSRISPGTDVPARITPTCCRQKAVRGASNNRHSKTGIPDLRPPRRARHQPLGRAEQRLLVQVSALARLRIVRAGSRVWEWFRAGGR